MAGIFLSLKVAIVKNRAAALRGNPAAGQSIGGHCGGGRASSSSSTAPAVYDSVSRTGSFPDPVPMFAQLSFSIVFLWIVLPLTYGGRRDLDVRKLQLLPIRPIAIALRPGQHASSFRRGCG